MSDKHVFISTYGNMFMRKFGIKNQTTCFNQIIMYYTHHNTVGIMMFFELDGLDLCLNLYVIRF